MLQMVARRLSALVPADGLAARIGGGEFVLLLPGADRAHPEAAAEQVIARLSGLPFDLGAGRVAALGVSIGVARLPEHGADLAAALAAADAALYEAKAKGRCQAVLALAVGEEERRTAPPLRIVPRQA